MILVAGTFEVEPARRDEFLASREEAMRRSRNEPGCVDYVFSADPLEPGRVVLFERWEDQASLDAHIASMRARDEPPSPVPVLSREVLHYQVSSYGPLG